MSGSVSYHSGLAAEASVAQHYEARGHKIARRRWKTRSGEIDLIAEKDGNVIFIEVKKSRSFARAAEALSTRQMKRIYASASQYLETCPDGQDSNARFDVALLNASGQIEVLENALCA